MANSSKIIVSLKKQLKVRGITYSGLADLLGLSESAVKHMFSTGNFSLRRLDEICDALELDISDLLTISEAQLQKIEQLSAEHEEEIMADDRLLLVAYCLINYWTFDEIVNRYDISPASAVKYLRRLDRMKVIELLPGDRVRLLIASNFRWRKNGAIEQFFRKRVQTEFFSHDFEDENSVRIVKNGMLSRKSQVQFMEKLRAIGDLFDEANWDDRKLPVTSRHGTTMVLATRHWFFEGFRHLER